MHAANVAATARLAAAAAARRRAAVRVREHGQGPRRSDAARGVPGAPTIRSRRRTRMRAARSRPSALLVAACEGGAMTPIVLRLPLVYGPGVQGELSGAARRRRAARAAAAAARSAIAAISVTSAISCMRSRRSSTASEPPAGAWLVADGEAVSTPDLVRRLAAALGVAPRLFPLPGRAARHRRRGSPGAAQQIARLVAIARSRRLAALAPDRAAAVHARPGARRDGAVVAGAARDLTARGTRAAPAAPSTIASHNPERTDDSPFRRPRRRCSCAPCGSPATTRCTPKARC